MSSFLGIKEQELQKFFCCSLPYFSIYLLCTRKPKLPNLRLQQRGLAKSDKHHHDGMLGTYYILESLDSMFVVVVEVELLTCLLSISKQYIEKFYLHSNRYLVKMLRLWVLQYLSMLLKHSNRIRVWGQNMHQIQVYNASEYPILHSPSPPLVLYYIGNETLSVCLYFRLVPVFKLVLHSVHNMQ